MNKKITKYKTRYGDANYKIEEKKTEIVVTEINLVVFKSEIDNLKKKRAEIDKEIKEKEELLEEIKKIK